MAGGGPMVYQRGALLHIAHLDEILGYLHGIERGALAYLVAGKPEGDAMVVGQVAAHAAYEDIVLARTLSSGMG